MRLGVAGIFYFPSILTIIGSLTPILTTHFIAHLRQVDMDDSNTTLPCSRAASEPLTFRPVTSVGASMSYEEDEHEVEPVSLGDTSGREVKS